jgi:TolB-like protein/Tfp pilus assembly protein PilF
MRASQDSNGQQGTVQPLRAEKSVAVLYFQNLSGAKEDEYFRDGMTEDIITELSKIRGLRAFSRPTVLAYRDREVTPAQIGQQLRASYVLAGSVRRSGHRLRINAQLIDTHTDFPLWSERYDREMEDVFEVQDEIARKIAEALRLTLSPQEEKAIARKPTDNLQAYDLYLRGKNYARRFTRADLEFALQMFESAVSLDPKFALGHAAIGNLCGLYYETYQRDRAWVDKGRAATEKAFALDPQLPEGHVAQAFTLYSEQKYDDAVRWAKQAIERKRDCEGAYDILCRALFVADRWQEIAEITDNAIEANGDDYNVYVPITNALEALGKTEAARNITQQLIVVLEKQLRAVPEDARARILLAGKYVLAGRGEDGIREMHIAVALRPNDAVLLYNVACLYATMGRKSEALDALRNSWTAGFRDPNWARRDPDLANLHGDPEFERLFADLAEAGPNQSANAA